MAFIYVTCKDKEEAQNIAKMLLGKNLIACANMWPVSSIYSWKGKVKEESEFVLFLKTLKEKFDEIKKEITRVHSYEIPCICLLDSECNDVFEKWVHESIE